MIKLKFALNLIYNATLSNIGKLIPIGIMLISFHYAGSFSDTVKKIKIDKTIEIDGGYAYIHKEIINDDISYEILFYKTPQKLDKDSNITTYGYNGINVIIWIIFIIFAIISIISIAVIIEDGFGFYEIYLDTFSSIVECDIEEGKYIYSIMGRLIGKSDTQIPRRYILNEFEVYNFFDLNTRPKYKSKSKHRDSLLNDLGIN